MIRKLTRLDPEPPWGFGAAIGALIVMFATIIIGTTISQVVLGDSTESLMAGWCIGMMLTIIFIRTTRMRTPQETQALLGANYTQLPAILIFGFGAAVMLDLITIAVVDNTSLAASELLNFDGVDVSLFGWVAAFLFMVILQPIAEELVFRGMIFPLVRVAAGAWTGLLISAAFHAMFHFIAYPPSAQDRTLLLWFGLALPFLDALVFSAVRAYTGSTRAAMVCHAAFGLFAILKILVLGS